SQLARQGGVNFLTAVVLGIAAAGWLVTLVLFLALRTAFGAVPAIVAPSPQQSQFTSSGPEMRAYVATTFVVIFVALGFNNSLLPRIFAIIRETGRPALELPVSLTISIVWAALFLLMFVALRTAMSAGTDRPGPLP